MLRENDHFRKARAAGQSDTAWQIAGQVAEDYLAWLCNGASAEESGQHGRGREIKIVERAQSTRVHARTGDPMNKKSNRLEKLHRKVAEAIKKFEVHGDDFMEREDNIHARMSMHTLWIKIQESVGKLQIPCDQFAALVTPTATAIHAIRKCTEAVQIRISKKACEIRCLDWKRKIGRAINMTVDATAGDHKALRQHIKPERQDPITALLVDKEDEAEATVGDKRYVVTANQVLKVRNVETI